jgi:hypothetical protein
MPIGAPALPDQNVTIEQIEVTPQTAQLWLAEAPYPVQRTPREDHVEMLAAEIARGWFRPLTVIEFCVLDGREHLVDGLDVLSAIARESRAMRLTVLRRSITSLAELRTIYESHRSPTAESLAP